MTTKRTPKKIWTKADKKALKAHSRNRTPVDIISREMKRTIGAIRQMALKQGFGIGHQR